MAFSSTLLEASSRLVVTSRKKNLCFRLQVQFDGILSLWAGGSYEYATTFPKDLSKIFYDAFFH